MDKTMKSTIEKALLDKYFPDRYLYMGTKSLNAIKTTYGAYCDVKGFEIPSTEEAKVEGYIVQYPDGYISWSPEQVFEETYRLITGAKMLPINVFPSDHTSIAVVPDADYGGAHRYIFQNSLGFKDGKAEYVDSYQFVQFVQKNDDGSMIPGIQSEQLVYVLLDRTQKLNQRFPSDFNEKMMKGLNMFLEACIERVKDRMDRGVMGNLKK